MKLLICTQAVDLDDPVLGFFHKWLTEFASRAEHIHVICLRAGRYSLPPNVSVHSLGKGGVANSEQRTRLRRGYGGQAANRIKYVVRFYRHIWRLRREYDAVFVHMNQEYVLLGGLLWRVLGKRVVLWRNHKVGSVFTNIASLLVHTVCYTSPNAYVAPFTNAVKMPIGIDTLLFRPSGGARDSILFLGRLDPVKNVESFLKAVQRIRDEDVSTPVDIVGDPTPGREAYADDIQRKYGDIPHVQFHRGVPNDATPALYASHTVYVNLTPSGSFDKTIGEALASGCTVVAANSVLRGVLPDVLVIELDVETIAKGIRAALAMDERERAELAERSRAYVEREHSLSLLSSKLFGIFSPRV